MKLWRAEDYNPPLVPIGNIREFDDRRSYRIDRQGWGYRVRTIRSEFANIFDWLDEHAGLDWDFNGLSLKPNETWGMVHNKLRGQLVSVQLSNIRHNHGHRPTSGHPFIVFDPKIAMLVKLTFQTHKHEFW